MNIPEGLFYSEEHMWLRVEGDTATIGITEFAQSELGEIVYVELPAPGSSFNKDEVFGTVEAVKTTSDLFMPVAGNVLAENDGLNQHPGFVNSDAFSKGWMISITIRYTDEVNSLLSAADYQAMIGRTN